MSTLPPTSDIEGATPPSLVRRGALVELWRHQPDDRAAFIRWYGDAEIAELLRHDLEPLTYIQARGYFDSIVLPSSARGTAWAIHDRATGALIGSTAVTEINPTEGSCLFRIVIGEKEAWGRGFGTDATRLVVAQAFETLDLRTVRLEVFEHNLRARRAYARVGFQETSHTVEWVPRRRQRLNVIGMEIDRDTWRATRNSQSTDTARPLS